MNDAYRRVYHYHVRKTAGTSLNEAFWSLAGLDLIGMGLRKRVAREGRTFVRHDPRLIAAGNYFFANSHVPAYHLRIPAESFTITILRDPVARVVSYYRYLLWARANPQARDLEPAIDGLRAETQFLGGSLAEFLARVPPEILLQQVSMFSARLDPGEAADTVMGCSAVCFTEDYSRDLARVGAELQLPLEEKRARRFGATVSLTGQEDSMLRERLALEYEFIARVKKALRGRQ